MQGPIVVRKKKEEDELPFLSLLTMGPTGNPLSSLSALQRQQFFEAMMRNYHSRRLEDSRRTMQLIGNAVAASFVPRRMAIATEKEESGRLLAEGKKEESLQRKTGEARGLEEQTGPARDEGKGEGPGTAGGAAGATALRQGVKEKTGSGGTSESPSEKGFGMRLQQKVFRKSSMQDEAVLPGGSGPSFAIPAPVAAGQGAASAASVAALGKLSFVLDDYARGNAAKASTAVLEFDSRLKSDEYRSADLMAVLLLVIEDLHYEGEEGAAGSSRHSGSKVGAVLVPQKLRETAKESAIVRLASVREMLRHYFERHPKEYASVLAAALGITADQEGDAEFLQERLASELAHIGGFALSQKILSELKRKKKLDRDMGKCLLELGYHFDRKTKKLVVGKRTCGTMSEARGIVSFLLSCARK